MCRELRALGATHVVAGPLRARFAGAATPAGQSGKTKTPPPMRQPTPEELEAAVQRQRQKELSRV